MEQVKIDARLTNNQGRKIVGKTTEQVLAFTNLGKSYSISLADIPLNEETYVNQLITLKNNEYVTNILSYDNAKNYKYVIFATKNGTIKKTDMKEYLGGARKSGLIALKVREDDELISTQLIENDNDRLFLATKNGNCLLLDQNDFSSTGRNTIGVKGINLSTNDELITMQIVSNNIEEIVSITAKGYGKRTPIKEFSLSNRATKGNLICRYKEDDDYLASVILLNKKSDTIIVNSKLSSLRLKVDTIPSQSRATIGVQMIKVTNNNLVKDAVLLEN